MSHIALFFLYILLPQIEATTSANHYDDDANSTSQLLESNASDAFATTEHTNDRLRCRKCKKKMETSKIEAHEKKCKAIKCPQCDNYYCSKQTFQRHTISCSKMKQIP